jgi:hypothetical protein
MTSPFSGLSSFGRSHQACDLGAPEHRLLCLDPRLLREARGAGVGFRRHYGNNIREFDNKLGKRLTRWNAPFKASALRCNPWR